MPYGFVLHPYSDLSASYSTPISLAIGMLDLTLEKEAKFTSQSFCGVFLVDSVVSRAACSLDFYSEL